MMYFLCFIAGGFIATILTALVIGGSKYDK